MYATPLRPLWLIYKLVQTQVSGQGLLLPRRTSLTTPYSSAVRLIEEIMRRMTILPDKERRINFEERAQGSTLLVTSLWLVLGIIAAAFLMVGISYADEVVNLNSPPFGALICPAWHL